MRTKVRNDKLNEALELLNEAAKEKREELYDLIGDKYAHIKDALLDTAETGKDVISKTKKEVIKALHDRQDEFTDKAKELDEKVHDHPWVYIGAAALGSIILGYLMKKK